MFFSCMTGCVAVGDCLRLGRKSDFQKVEMEKKFSQRLLAEDGDQIELEAGEEKVFIEAMVGSQNLNVWAILMPAVSVIWGFA